MVTFFVLLWLFAFVRSLQANGVSQWNFDQNYYSDNDHHSLIKGSRSLLQLFVGKNKNCDANRHCLNPWVCVETVKGAKTDECKKKIALTGKCKDKCINDDKTKCINVEDKECTEVCCEGLECGDDGKKVKVNSRGVCVPECVVEGKGECVRPNDESAPEKPLLKCCDDLKCGKNGQEVGVTEEGEECQKECRDKLNYDCHDSDDTKLWKCCGKDEDGNPHRCGHKKKEGEPYPDPESPIKRKAEPKGQCMLGCVKDECTKDPNKPLLHCCPGLKCEDDAGQEVEGKNKGNCKKPATNGPSPHPTTDPLPDTDPSGSPSTDPTDSPSTDPTGSPSTDPTGSPTTDPLPANNIPAQHIAFKMDHPINTRDKKYFYYFGGALFVVISLLVTLLLFKMKACCAQYQFIKDQDESDDEIKEQDEGNKLI